MSSAFRGLLSPIKMAKSILRAEAASSTLSQHTASTNDDSETVPIEISRVLQQAEGDPLGMIVRERLDNNEFMDGSPFNLCTDCRSRG